MNNIPVTDKEAFNEFIKQDAMPENDLSLKKKVVEEYRVNRAYEQVQETKKELDAISALDFSLSNNSSILKGIQMGREYMDSANKCMRFVNYVFNGKVPFYPKNIILCAAYSADGKSTLTANIAYDLMVQKKKILIITNEEALSDVYNRVTCLAKGWVYGNHEKFTKEQKDIFDECAINLASRMYVIDNANAGASNITTSYEGMVSIMDSLLRQETKYDAIIIDYYQNISMMKADPAAPEWKVQAKFVKYLDQFKNLYPAPIVVMSQLKPQKEDSKMSFKERIEGSKSIFNICTFAMEIKADKPNLCTTWTIHKSRFNGVQGDTFTTGWESGKYVAYTDEFRIKVIRHREQKALDAQRFQNNKKEENNEQAAT